MALPTPTITYQDGAAAAAVSLAANATAVVTAGNALTILLASTTGVTQASWNVLMIGQVTSGPTSYSWAPGYGPAGFTIALPQSPVTLVITTEVTDGNNATVCTNTFTVQNQASSQLVLRALGTTGNNNESLTAFVSVTGGTIRDGVTYVEGDYVLLTGQTTKKQNGLYQVGPVAAGTAPLSRVSAFPTGQVFSDDVSVEVLVGSGTLYGNTTWRLTTAGPITVDTTSIDFYPNVVNQAATLVAGKVVLTNVPIFSATTTAYVLNVKTANTTSSTISYQPLSIVAGAFGGGSPSVQVTATVAAGTIDVANISTMIVSIVNFG